MQFWGSDSVHIGARYFFFEVRAWAHMTKVVEIRLLMHSLTAIWVSMKQSNDQALHTKCNARRGICIGMWGVGRYVQDKVYRCISAHHMPQGKREPPDAKDWKTNWHACTLVHYGLRIWPRNRKGEIWRGPSTENFRVPFLGAKKHWSPP